MKGIILQEVLLNQVRREETEVAISMVNGQEYIGCVNGFDSFTILLEDKGTQTLLYKHAVVSVTPSKFVQLSQRKTV